MIKQGSLRRYDLDWIKVIATLLVFLYHCSMFFNPFDWHVKNNELNSSMILAFSLMVGTWIMPVFFVISGISSHYSLKKRKAGTYLKERLIRLGIPLLFGIFILSPPQVYIERVGNQQFTGTFLEFLPHAFSGLYLEIGGTGNFAFVGLHLWYLLALILFSFLTIYLFRKTAAFSNITAVHLCLLHIVLIPAAIFIKTAALGGWDLVVYLLFFLAGYYIFSSVQLASLLKKTFPIHFILGSTSLISYTVWFLNGIPEQGSAGFSLFTSLAVVGSINVILSFSYLADKYLSFTNRILRYASEASLPFYILHQPVIVLTGFLIKDLNWPVLVKFPFLAVVTFIVISAAYHFVIRPLTPLRILFGIPGKKRKISLPAPPAPKASI